MLKITRKLLILVFIFVLSLSVTTEASKKPKIIKQPKSVTAEYSRKKVQMEVQVKGHVKVYDWQYNAGKGWKATYLLDEFDENDNILYIKPTCRMNGWKVRCRITYKAKNNKRIYILSKAVKLKVRKTPTIISQPTQVYTRLKGVAEFGLTVKGDNLMYKWQKKVKNKWVTIKKTSKPSLVVKSIKKKDNNTYYRCLVRSKWSKRVIKSKKIKLVVTDIGKNHSISDSTKIRGLVRTKALDGYIYVTSGKSKHKKEIKEAIKELNKITGTLFIYTSKKSIADLVVVDYSSYRVYKRTLPYLRKDMSIAKQLVSKEAAEWAGVAFSTDDNNEHYLIALNDFFIESYPSSIVTTVIMHELAHCIGIGHSKDPNSIMYYTLWNQHVTKEDIKKLVTQAAKVRNLSL
jgi:hypothetical protein